MSKDWRKVQLVHYVNELPKSKHLSGSSDESGVYDFYVCSPIKQKSKFFDRDDTAVMLSTGGEFSVHLTRGKYAYSSDVWGLKGKDALTTEFLFRWFELYKDRLNYKGFQGSGIQHLDKDYCRTRTLRLPEIQEQQKIAEILTSVDEVIENTESEISKLEDLKKATLNELLTKGIGHTEFKDSEIGRIPREWTVIRLEKCVEHFQNGYAFSSDDYVSSGIPIISMSNISLDGTYQFNEENEKKWSKEKIDSLSRYVVMEGDIIIAMTDVTPQMNLIGRGAIVRRKGLMLLNQRVGLLRTDDSLQKEFLALLTNSDYWRINAKRSAGLGAQANLGTSEILRTFIPLPQIDEQNEIVEVIETQEIASKKLRLKRESLEYLKKSLMQDLLTGKVRVTVN